MNQIDDNELDLFDFFETLWESRSIIIIFVLITMSLGGVVINVIEPKYESKIIYTADKSPPFYSKEERISMDFEKLFYNENIFIDWKSSNEKSILTLKNISPTQKIGNVLFSKPERKRTVLHSEDDEIGPYIIVRSKERRFLDDVFKYAHHVNSELTRDYILRAKDEIKIMYKRFNDPRATTESLTEELLAVDRFLVEAEKGNKVLLLSHPSFPEQISPRTNLILVISFLLGLLIAIIYIFFRDGYRSRKAQEIKMDEVS